MFFSRFFTRDCSQLKAKGDKLFTAGHFAEARHVYLEALEKADAAENHAEEQHYLRTQISSAGNRLAELNLTEAEAAMRSGNTSKGEEYLRLALELADDVSLREKAEVLQRLSADFNLEAEPVDSSHASHGCSSCSSAASAGTDVHGPTGEHLTPAEQFKLLVHTLPGELTQRYTELGENFASAYLLAHSDKTAEALTLMRQLPSADENDIILYETAILYFRSGEPAACERLLRRALEINSSNPLCYLGLAQLLVDSARYPEAESVLSAMLERGILPDQTTVMLGDVQMLQGDSDRAIEIFTAALDSPVLKKTAAERLVRILASQGREQEAAYLAKTYLKGCC